MQSCAGKTAHIDVINYGDKEYYQLEKDGVRYHCMSDYYLNEVIQAKIKVTNPQ